jgi:hypothetical protein
MKRNLPARKDESLPQRSGRPLRLVSTAESFGTTPKRHRHHSIACPTLIQRFLPWYRNYLLKFEEAMRAFEPRFRDWTVGGSIPSWLALFTVRGICDLNGKEIRIERARHAASDMAVCRGTLDRLMAHTDYISFSQDLELVHNCVHAWTGGTMDD